MHGNTSINPFFYGTFLGETKPGEPVTRTKKQAFQADAVGAAHQLTPEHFKRPHTFRLEWQPGKGGRLDWYVKGYRINATTTIEGDGNGTDWTLAFSLKDSSLSKLMGSQIPIEPSYLIMNTAISSTWGFPYDAPEWCPKCFDCDDPKCACNFYPGFCEMLDAGSVTMLIDSVRIYQTTNHSAHVGAPHSLGCDPPEYPTREWIKGHEYRYMRNEPFAYADKGHSMKPVQRGRGECRTDADCGGAVQNLNLTQIFEVFKRTGRQLQNTSAAMSKGRGACVPSNSILGFLTMSPTSTGKVCRCFDGFTGPHCMTLQHIDNFPSAQKIRQGMSPFRQIENFEAPGLFLISIVCSLAAMLALILVSRVMEEKRSRRPLDKYTELKRPVFISTPGEGNVTVVTGTSI